MVISSINSALSGLGVYSGLVTAAAGNLANLNTTGYKAGRLDLGTRGSMSQGGIEVGQGAQILNTSRDFSSGPLLSTGSEFDLAIQGDGFFKVSRGGQDVYTRDGSFHLDKDRFLVDAQGNRLQPDFQLPTNATSVQLGRNGQLTARDGGGNIVASADLSLSRFANPDGLASIGQNDFLPTAASGVPRDFTPGTGGAGALTQGALEGANVDPAREMINLMLGSQGYAANIKSLKTAEEMLQTVIDIRA